MAKTKKKITVAYVVISEDENKFFGSFKEAETYAKDTCEVKEEEIMILEVVKAWTVYFPEEPAPDTLDMDLGNLLEI